MNRMLIASLASASVALLPALGFAHISVTGPGFADKTQEISFNVGHGCDGKDTARVRVDIPAGVTSVRVMSSDFGKVKVERDSANLVSAVTWEKSEQLPADDAFYKLALRIKVPNKPFTTLVFPTHQTCIMDGGVEKTVDWIAESEVEGGPEPAPVLKVLPARRSGWNKYTVPAAITDLSKWFDDAQIVWKGNAAYSANPAVAEQAKGTDGVSELTELAAGDEIWVKY